MAKIEIATTQRAYTLRLRGATPDDTAWRDALWATHNAVNNGAKVFGDWLLTLRGGLCHTLADAKVPQGKDKPERDPTEEERRDRRILLALSWLSVESVPKENDPYKRFVVAGGNECQSSRDEKVIPALRQILEKRRHEDAGLDVEGWIKDCQPSLSAAIRDDAVWVNRSAAFDQVVTNHDVANARKDCCILLKGLFNVDYLTLPRKPIKPKKSQEAEDREKEKDKAVIKSGKGAGQQTRHLFSHLFGESKRFGKNKSSLELHKYWRCLLKERINKATGIPLGTGTESGRSPTELHREMFSKAAARLAQIWTKQKQQEVERAERQAADEALRQMEQMEQSFAEPLGLLNEYCEQRQVSSGALGSFRITSRQITGWKRVVESWKSIKAQDVEAEEKERIEAAKSLQDEDQDKKFGDINFFIDMAEEKYKPVWFHEGKSNAELLEKYVEGMRARADAKRLKIASYRHPDPYFNPIFCQFGNSRPQIKFLRLCTSKTVEGDRRIVKILLWDPAKQKADLRDLHALSSRFDSEIGSAPDTDVNDTIKLPEVTRRSRLGCAAAGLTEANDKLPIVTSVFDRKEITKRKDAQSGEENPSQSGTTKRDPEWNGTLSADRRALADLGKLAAKKHDNDQLKKKRNQLRWTLIVSLKLEPRGPWYDFIKKAVDKSPFQRTVRKHEKKGQMLNGKNLSYDWPFEEENKTRGLHAKLILSRLPGLRILSVDLGHRHAAACAVWETLTIAQMKKACQEANHDPPTKSDLFLHLARTVADGKKRTTIYRRIGADNLHDNKEHPAPWARLDRQFLIKLQGEDAPARAASKNEIQLIDDFAERLGLVPDDRRKHDRSVDELMSQAVLYNAKLGLKRHARRAKIAYALDPNTRSIPGMGGREENFTPGDKDHTKFLTDALLDWRALAADEKWDDKPARELWNQHIAALPDGWRVEDPKPHHETALEPKQRRKDDDALRQRLQPIQPIAKQLIAGDRADMHKAWKERWEKDDGQKAVVPVVPKDQKGPTRTSVSKQATGLHAELRRLTDWIMGRRLQDQTGATTDGWRQNVGGLSLTRIATMKSLYQLHKAFAMRPRPDKPRGAPEKGETNAGVAQSILDAMKRMREQRVKQLASRIVEAALGVGIERCRSAGRDLPRPRERIDNPRFAPCHAVVIENLKHYRPDELQTRWENRQLMNWSSRKVEKYLSEACQLHGLLLREVQAGYTSRQDSRTGAPGVRCADVPVHEFKTAPWWHKQVDAAKKKKEEKNGGSARDKYLLDLIKLDEATWKTQRPLRIPVNGGELFVSASPCHCCKREDRKVAPALQADLNAAANIGLKALLDPDWPGKWWYVPCESTTYKPHAEKTKGSAAIDHGAPLIQAKANVPVTDAPEGKEGKTTSRKAGKKEREIINLWRDPTHAPINSNSSSWRSYKEYRNDVECRVVGILQRKLASPSALESAVASGDTPW